MKKFLIFLGAVLGVFVVISGGVLVKLYLETRQMNSLETGKIITSVYAVQDSYVNLFLVKTHDTYIAFDAGNDKSGVQQGLEKLHIDPKKIAAVFLTHSDVDHIAAIRLFPNAVIYLSKAEEQMVNGQTRRFLFMKNCLAPPYELVEDNQVITISGLKIKGLLTPGHTPGSMCFLVNDTYLFAGDTMGIKNGKVTKFNDFFNMDSQRQAQSLAQLAALSGVKYIFTAHYGFSDSPEIAFRSWKK